MTDETPADKAAPATPETPPKQLLILEQRIGLGLCAGAAVVVVALFAAGSAPAFTLAAGLPAVAGVALSTRYQNRFVTAVIALIAGALLGTLGLLFLFYGGFLMLRASRAQGKINASKPRLTPAQRAEERRQRREGRRSGGGSSGSAATGSAGGTTARRPAANRRYTPPKSKARRR